MSSAPRCMSMKNAIYSRGPGGLVQKPKSLRYFSTQAILMPVLGQKVLRSPDPEKTVSKYDFNYLMYI